MSNQDIIKITEQTAESDFKVSTKTRAPHVLLSGEVTLANFERTRNGRIFSPEVHEFYIKSDRIQRLMSQRKLFGNLDHPIEGEDFFYSLKNAVMSITDMWCDYSRQCVRGHVDILDINQGPTVKALVEYGSKIGFSIRGTGRPNPDGTFAPSRFKFITYDIVANNSCPEADLMNGVLESENLSVPEIQKVLEDYSSAKPIQFYIPNTNLYI